MEKSRPLQVHPRQRVAFYVEKDFASFTVFDIHLCGLPVDPTRRPED